MKVDVRYVPCAGVSVATFSEFPESQSRACELIRAGIMRARSTLRSEREEPAFPRAGDALIAIDGFGVLQCICRIRSVAVKRFGDVDASDAWLEGIGDRSLQDWRAARGSTFMLRARLTGAVFSESTEVVLERFELAWETHS